MKITLVCDILGKEDNGTTIASTNLIRFLEKKHDVRVLCCDETKKNLPNYYVTPKKKFPKVLNDFLKSTSFALAKPDMDIVKKAVIGADVIHCLEPFALTMAAIRVARKHNIPVTAAVHLLPEHLNAYVHLDHVPGANMLIHRYWWDHVYSKVQAMHFPTQLTKELYFKYNRGAKYIAPYVISNGIRTNVKAKRIPKPKQFENKIVILCSGRYSPEKSQATLIKAVKLSKYSDRIQLIFAGKGQLENKFKRLSQDLPIKPIFKIYKHEELIDIVNYSDLVVHPSILETEGISVLEAIVCGKLVIVSNARKSASRLFGINKQCIFKAKSPQALAQTIDYWIDNPKLKKKAEKRNLKIGKKYRINFCLKQLEKMIIKAKKQFNKK